jgi:hypothetical protein
MACSEYSKLRMTTPETRYRSVLDDGLMCRRVRWWSEPGRAVHAPAIVSSSGSSCSACNEFYCEAKRRKRDSLLRPR